MPKNAKTAKTTKVAKSTQAVAPSLATESTPNPESLEQRIANLDKLVEWFYSDDFALDQAILRYKNASELAASIEQDLSNLKNQVEVIEDFTKS